ncbi:MAG TPA: hypothetical protein VKB88_15220 [Bryobacteraceae bacterium]|nr:hypothetical protein [Bryobacteraceae bacterium]
MPHPKIIAYCSLATLIALYVVGAVSNGSLRHEVQTMPLWFPIVLGFRQRDLAKWTALPCLLIWLVLMTFIWLFLLGWARIISGHFSPVEVTMTLVVGVACVIGISIAFRWRTAVSWGKGMRIAGLFALLQLAALRISFIPYIARH